MGLLILILFLSYLPVLMFHTLQVLSKKCIAIYAEANILLPAVANYLREHTIPLLSCIQSFLKIVLQIYSCFQTTEIFIKTGTVTV